ncbi:MAG: Apolipoprotein N-acyltransferase [Verrucomicrobiales bacterium]|nr:Apolipoprotein N-acyltransferase [Verrucomicrobiales bacterium]
MLAAFAAGLLLAAAFPAPNISLCAWIVPGLMLWICCEKNGRLQFRIAYCAGLGRWVGSIYWLLYIPFHVHAIAGFVALAAVLASFTAAWCWMCLKLLGPRDGLFPERLKRATVGHQLLWPLMCAAAWVAIEMGTARVFTGFPWNILGASQYRFLPLIQISSFTGVYGVSLLVVWSSVGLVTAIALRNSIRRASLPILPPLLASIAAVIYGQRTLAAPETASTKIKIALVQPSIPQPTIWDANEKTNRFLKLVDLSKQALEKSPDILVWPEAAMPDIFTRNKFTQHIISQLVTSKKCWMVMGASDSRPKPNGAPAELEWANSAFLINPAGELVSRYNKKHLVVFGEYMPLANIFPFLGKLRSSGAGLASGSRDVFFTTSNPRAHFPAVICYEDMFPHEVRDRVDAETDFILNLTNDGWFGDSNVQWQHAINALFRAIENGIPLVRCTNNGLTCWIDSHGNIHETFFENTMDIHQAGWKIAEVPLRSHDQPPTFYTKHGDILGWTCVAITAVLLPLFASKRH